MNCSGRVRLRRSLLGVVATAGIALTTSCGTAPQASEPAASPPSQGANMDSIAPLEGRALFATGEISDESRSYLTRRMRNHGHQATDLLDSVVLLDLKTTKRISRKMAKPDPVTSIDQPSEYKLHSEFPETFFELESSMRTQALRLYAEATRGDPEMVLREFSGLVGRCVECHALFTKRSEVNVGSMGPLY